MADFQTKKQNMEAFNMPIPGQGLTATPGRSRWEQPSEMNDITEIADWFWQRITSDYIFKDLMRMLDAGVPVNVVVSHLVMMGVMGGKFNTDMALLITPIVITQIVYLAKMAGANISVHTKKDPGIDPAPIEKLFNKQTSQTSEIDNITSDDIEQGLLAKPKGK